MRICVGVLAIWAFLASPLAAAADKPKPIILDTDIGTDIDDTFALALAVASPDIELVGVTTVGSEPQVRARIVCRFLTAVGKRQIPVAAGAEPQPERKLDGARQYAGHPAVIYNRTSKPVKESAVEFLYQQLKARPTEITIVCTGPLTNLARLLKEHPDCQPWIRRIVFNGGTIALPKDAAPKAHPVISADVSAAKTVFGASVPLIFVWDEAARNLKLDASRSSTIFRACTPLTMQVESLFQLAGQSSPVVAAPLAPGWEIWGRDIDSMVSFWEIEVDDNGIVRTAAKPKRKMDVLDRVDEDKVLSFLTQRLTSFGKKTLPSPPGNRSTLIPRTGLPLHVHTFEDYDTDIERRWWMSGKAETTIVPPGGVRACRGVLTQDFDDLQGDMKTMYTAVIFNPVPGPPMGKNTRLSFRYWLKGTDTLRVQLYSLTRGFHRYLSVTGLPQEQWGEGTVDMTQMRRPDGTGGPLAEDERIDDIQFYVDPRAELVIDDVVLYDAAPEGEKQPFPKRFLYTGWFDTGKQGKEWPGDFTIVEHEAPRKWNAAKSVLNPETERPWIRLYLRGERPLAESLHLRFRYRLSGAENMTVHVGKTLRPIKVKADKPGEWAETTLDFGKTRPGDKVDEIRFELASGAELLLDDVLLFEPGISK